MSGSLNTQLISGIPTWDRMNAVIKAAAEDVVPIAHSVVWETEWENGVIYGCKKSLIVPFGEVIRPLFDHGKFYIGALVPSLRRLIPSLETDYYYGDFLGIGGRVVEQALKGILQNNPMAATPWLIYRPNPGFRNGTVWLRDAQYVEDFGTIMFKHMGSDSEFITDGIQKMIDGRSCLFRVVNEF